MTRMIRIILLSSVAFSGLGCSKPPLPQSPPPTSLPLKPSMSKPSETFDLKNTQKTVSKIDGNWQLKSATGLATRPVDLKISGKTYYLYAGCNRMRGRLQLSPEGNAVKFQRGMSSLMGCPDTYESDVLRLLTQSQNLELTQDSLVFSGPEGVMTFARLKISEIILGEWKVQGLNINGGVVSSVDQPLQTLKFTNGEFSGFDGCNTVQGRYIVEDEKIDIQSVRMTKKACVGTDEGYDWAKAYSEALQGASKTVISTNRIELRSDKGSLLISLIRP